MVMIRNTENDSSQPAMRVKRRGEKSLAGLTADPAFRPKLGVANEDIIFGPHIDFVLYPTFTAQMAHNIIQLVHKRTNEKT